MPERLAAAVIALVMLSSGAARADDGTDPRPIHGSAGIGTALLLAGARGDHNRFEAEIDLEPQSRYGALVALRDFDGDHHGVLDVGLIFEPAAARPLLVLDLHADLGFDLDQRAPMLGGGLRTTITIVAPLGIALDSGAYLVLDGVASTRLALSSSAQLVARW